MSEYPHGTLERRWRSRCSCRPCKDAKNAYDRHRTRMIAYGRWQSYVDAEPSRQHVKALMASGVTLCRIAQMADLSAHTLRQLMHGTPAPTTRVRPSTEQAILAVRPGLDDLPDTAWVSAAGTRRRARALAAIGYTLKDQAEALGKLISNYRAVLAKSMVAVSTARQVRDLYDAWSSSPPPQTWIAERSRRDAQRRGWLPPAAWDDDLLDLTDEAYAQAVRDQAAHMPDTALSRAWSSRYEHGDTSPLTLELIRERSRRQAQRVKQRAQAGEAS